MGSRAPFKYMMNRLLCHQGGLRCDTKSDVIPHRLLAAPVDARFTGGCEVLRAG
jgi:hypothetical protein